MKLCKDCRFHKPDSLGVHGEFDKCARPIRIEMNRIDGSPTTVLHRWNYCQHQRDVSKFSLFQYIFKMCGERARYFKSK
jgi:hypothetical protein